MKRYLIYFIVSILFACENDATWQHAAVTCEETIITTRHTATISLCWDDASAPLVQYVSIKYDTTEELSQAQVVEMRHIENKQEVTLNDLKDGITYYVQYFVVPEYLQPQKTASSFKTVNPLKPTVQTSKASAITETTAVLHGKATIFDNYDITERGFYYSLTPESDFERRQVKCGNGEGDFDATITALRANATYYFWAYAVNQNGIAYGDTLTFNTLNPYE